MSLNFGISADSAVRNTRRPLNPWEIHTVKFKGVEVREFNGKKDPTAHYKVLNVNYENEDGYFSLSIFYPKDGDDQRGERDGANGGKIPTVSPFENTMAIIKQTVQVLNPKGFEVMQKASSKFKSFDDVVTVMKKVLDPVKDKEIKIKLTGRNRDGKVVAQIPHIVAINKEGEAFICDNYIGDKLFWSDYEMKERDKYKGATPSAAPETSDPVVETTEDNNNDLNIDDLL